MKFAIRLVGLALLLFLTLSIAGVPPAQAHAKLVKANPAPGSNVGNAPAQVQLYFDEPIGIGFSEVQVLDANRQRVDTGVITLAPDDPKSVIAPVKGLTDGTYTVIWKVLSEADGHVTRGVFAFNVGNVAGPAVAPVDTGAPAAYELNPISAVARWLSLYSLLALVGGFVFRWYFLDRSLDAVAAEKKARGIASARWNQLTLVLFVLFLAANFGELGQQVQLVAEQFSFVAVNNVVLNTRFGTLWLARMGLMGLAALLLFLTTRRVSVPYVFELVTGLGAAALMTRSLLGHSASVSDAWLPIAADWLHLVAIAVWVGGLVYFAWLMPFMWRALQDSTRSKWIAWLIPEFSLAAIACTIIIAGTGIYNSRVQIPELDRALKGDFSDILPLASNLYASALGAKILLFLVMLLLGAVNLLWISPRMRAYVTAPDKSARLFTRFRVTVGAEVLLGIAVIFLGGILTLSPPPRSEPPQTGPAIAEQAPDKPIILFGSPGEDVRAILELGPKGSAPEQLKVTLSDAGGKPLSDVQRVIFQFMYLNDDAGLQNVNAELQSDGTYLLSGNYFPLDGMWRIRLTVRQQGKPDGVVEFPYFVSNAPPQANDVDAARLMLQESQTRMNELSALRASQQLNDGTNAVVLSDYEYLAPDRTRFVIEGQGQAIAIGALQYLQTPNGAWLERARVEPFVFPQFDFADTAEAVQFGRQETINRVPAQIVLFQVPDTLGENQVRYAYWIAEDDKRVLQFAMVAPAHYMMETFRDWDSRDIVIEKPTDVIVAPTAAPVTQSGGGSAITNMVVASPRPRGVITGDLEGDGALILVVTGVVVLLIGGGGKRTRKARLTLLGIGAASVLLGIGLFVDAVNGTITAATNTPVNMSRATPGEIVFTQNCAVCHGPKGLGDGPGGETLPVKPFDLTTHFFQHDEQYHFQTILNGRGYMPAFGSRLSQDQIVDVIAYIRLLAIQARQQSANPNATPIPGFTPRPGFTPQP